MYTVQLPGLLLKRYNRNYTQNATRLASFLERYDNSGKFRDCRKKLSLWLKEHSGQMAKACTRQFEFIAAQRIRRSLQIFHLYTRIWDEVALKEFMKSWRNRALKNTKQFLMSTIGVSMYNWDCERISEAELNSYKQEIEGIHKLKDTTVICSKCQLRIVIDVAQPDIKYCTCADNKSNVTANQDSEGWTPYIELQDMLIWRREEPNSGGLFAYKVYGSFSDVTAEDFLQAQIDVEYRKEWDTTARELKVIDTDPKTEITTTDSGKSTDVIYWETIWPGLFSNRDYVYQRRWVVDEEKRIIIIVSRATEHPSAPAKSGVHRVTTYWSYMVIRPYTEFNQPGIEFGLTYFDDPGVNIPSTITSWVAMKGLPNYLIRMREASKDYKTYKITKLSPCETNMNDVTLTDEDVVEDNVKQGREKHEDLNSRKMDECNSIPNTDIVTFREEQVEESNVNGECTENTVNLAEEDRGLLRYFFLTKLFV